MTTKSRDSDEEWKALLARGAAVRAAAKKLADQGQPLRFTHKERRPVLVSRCLDTPGEWRTTWFDKDGQPTGHTCDRSAYDAFFSVLISGYEPVHRRETVAA